MTKQSLLAVAVVAFALLIVEFAIIPSIFWPLASTIDGGGFVVGLALLTVPRAILVIIVTAACSRIARNTSVLLPTIAYTIILASKYAMSETYVAPGNAYATVAALGPYVIGLAAFVASANLLWRDNRSSAVA